MARGRNADHPAEIPPKGWKDILLRVKDRISDDHTGLIAAGVAFYGLLALFPAITAMMALAGLLVEPQEIIGIMNSLEGLVPQDVLAIITAQAEEVAGSREGGLGLTVILGLLLAIYSASKGVGSLMEGMNVAYAEDETRGFFVLTFVKLSLTVAVIIGVIVALIVVGGVPTIFAVDAVVAPLSWVITGGTILLAAALTTFGLALLYRYGPSRDNPRWVWLSPGAVIGCIGWAAASAGFAFYVSTFGNYTETFGTMAGVIVLLMWMWVSAFVILLGAELNAETEAQTKKDSTVGRPQPMGQRDARKADVLGPAKASAS